MLWKRNGCQVYTLHYHRGLRGAAPTIKKAFSKVKDRPYYQTQALSMTENNFLLLIQQKKRFSKK
jgi:hypothetical protein